MGIVLAGVVEIGFLFIPVGEKLVPNWIFRVDNGGEPVE